MPRPWGPMMVPPSLDGRVLSQTLELLLAWNLDYLYRHPDTPGIYESGVRYIPEPEGLEVWKAIPWVIASGGSVCHSLACWRAAELIVRGEDAWPIWTVSRQRDGSRLFHVRVQRGSNTRTKARPNGQIEDPSLILGMGRPQAAISIIGPAHHVASPPGVEWY